MRDPWAALRTCSPVWADAHGEPLRHRPGPRKQCRTCGESLPVGDFYKGRVSRKPDCKACYKSKVIERRQLTG